MPVDYARYTQYALHDMLQKNGFNVSITDKSGHFVSALHQLFIVYLYNDWLHRVPFFSRFLFFKKVVRQLIVPALNYVFLLFEPLWPKSYKFYLSTIILAEKTA